MVVPTAPRGCHQVSRDFLSDFIMRSEVQCSCCERTGGRPAGGAAINSIGCTGACLHWAVQLIVNPPFWDEEPLNWQPWAFDPVQWDSFSTVCSDLNGLGCGYLSVDCVEAHISNEVLTAEEWIAMVCHRYQYFLEHAPVQEIAARCSHLPRFYDVLETLCDRCLEMACVVYTIFVELAHDCQCQIRTRNMNGTEVHSCMMSWWEPVKPWQHYPEPVYRIACDGNLYTFTEYCTYYGSHKAAWMWLHSLACYDHVIQLVDEGGYVVQ